MLPTFLTIGAMKCGTTSLHAYLPRHPGIYVSEPKELDFFSDDCTFARGLAWYEQRFSTDRPIRGEASPNYSKRHLFPAAAARIARALPDARLIYLVRNPAERFLSNYVQSLATGFESRSLPELLRAKDRNFDIMFDTGRYLYQLEAYLEHFPKDRILVLRAEDLAVAHRATLHSIVAFLGADPSLYPEGTAARHHESSAKGMLRPWAKRLSVLGRPARAALRRLPKGLVESPIPRPVFGVEDRGWLMERYRQDIAGLERFCGRTMGWF